MGIPPETKPNLAVAGTLLLVDDELSVLETVACLLELDGYRVLTAASGQEALDVATREAVDAILLDVQMPNMDGFQVLQELGRRPALASIPVLFVTGHAIDSESIRRGLEMGARDYIAKPAKRPELLARVSSVVRIGRMERELRQMNASLREQDRRRHQYLAMASHDIRSPLATASKFCKILLGGGYGLLSDDQGKAVQRLRFLVDYMGVLVNNLLDLEKVEEGSLQVALHPTDVGSLVSEAVEMHRMAAEERGIFLAVEMAPDLQQVPLDHQLMLQAINNLLGNALKFTPSGGRVTVSARIAEDDLALSVADTGPGIPLPEHPLLFRPFQQLSVRSITNERGAGLGLCIVKNLVELHGGKISVDSAPGRGTCFSMRLPARPKEARPS